MVKGSPGDVMDSESARHVLRPRRSPAVFALLAAGSVASSQLGCGDNLPAGRQLPVTQDDAGTPAGDGAVSPAAAGLPRLMVPAYFYPGAEWDRLIAAAPAVGMVIANPADGPGAGDAVYQEVIGRAQQAGVAVLGYVATSYGQRASADVLQDIQAYFDLYHPSGIYLSEGPMQADCAAMEQTFLGYAQAARARDPRAYVALGTRYCPSYIYFSDIIVLFARQQAEYDSFQPGDWMPGRSADRFAHLVVEVPGDQLEATLRRAQSLGAGWVYVTDDTLPNPWDTLAGYFDRELQILSTLR
jgi:hypothetical protein